MYSLILVATFTPFLWGDSSTTSREINGFSSQDACAKQAAVFRNSKTDSGMLEYSKYCILKDNSK